MSNAAIVTLLLFLIPIAASAAPMRWPQCAWLAGLIFWLSGIPAVGLTIYLTYTNWDWLVDLAGMKGLNKQVFWWIVFALCGIGMIFSLSRIGAGVAGTETSAEPESALRMAVGESGPFCSTTGNNPSSIKRTFNLKVENTDRIKALTDCKIHLTSATPQTDYEGPWLLKEGVSLAPGGFIFIPLVTYGEACDPKTYNCADSFMTMGTPNGRPTLDADKQHSLTVKATAMGTPWSEVQCKVWVEAGRLRIARAPSSGSEQRRVGGGEPSISARPEPVEKTWLPVLDLIDLAEREHGWNFKDDPGGYELLDFLYGLRLAGSHRTVFLWGKKNHGSDYEGSTRRELIGVIDKSHWRSHRLDVFKAMLERSNFHVWTLDSEGSAHGGFADVQVTDYTAIAWLRDVANTHKGHTRKSHEAARGKQSTA